MQHQSKPFPPFGEILHKYLSMKRFKPTNAVYVYCGQDSWRCAENSNNAFHPALCLPPDQRVEAYQWPVKGLSLILFNTGNMSEESLRTVAFSLIESGAVQVCVYNGDCIPVEIYHQ